jgi:hypothetical protein
VSKHNVGLNLHNELPNQSSRKISSAEFQKQSYAVTPQAISIEIEGGRLYLSNGQGVLISHTLSSGAAVVQLSRACGNFKPEQHLCMTAAKGSEGAAAANPVLPPPQNEGAWVVMDSGDELHALVHGDEDDLP